MEQRFKITIVGIVVVIVLGGLYTLAYPKQPLCTAPEVEIWDPNTGGWECIEPQKKERFPANITSEWVKLDRLCRPLGIIVWQPGPSESMCPAPMVFYEINGEFECRYYTAVEGICSQFPRPPYGCANHTIREGKVIDTIYESDVFLPNEEGMFWEGKWVSCGVIGYFGDFERTWSCCSPNEAHAWEGTRTVPLELFEKDELFFTRYHLGRIEVPVHEFIKQLCIDRGGFWYNETNTTTCYLSDILEVTLYTKDYNRELGTIVFELNETHSKKGYDYEAFIGMDPYPSTKTYLQVYEIAGDFYEIIQVENDAVVAQWEVKNGI